MTDIDVATALEEVQDLVYEYDEDGYAWSDDEVRDAFVSALPSIRLVVEKLEDLYS